MQPLDKSWADILPPKMHRFGVVDLRNSGLFRAIRDMKELPLGCALNQRILIDNLFGPDLLKGS
jgi:hypothetical protein